MGRHRKPENPEKLPPWTDLLQHALAYVEAVAEVEQVCYGSFLGGDPRTFTPDEEVCTEEEIAAWKAACAAWAGGDRTPVPIGCIHGSSADGKTHLWITGRNGGMGLGTNRFHDFEAVELVQSIRKKLKMDPWTPPARQPNDVDLPDEIDLDTILPPGPAAVQFERPSEDA